MQKMIDIAITDLRVFLKDRENLVVLVVMPVILTLVIGFASTGGSAPSRVRIDVVDLDGSQLSQQFLASLRAVNNTLILCPMDNDDENVCLLDEGAVYNMEESLERIENGQTNAVIVLPEGYGEDLQAFNEVDIPYYSRANAVTGDAILQSVQATVQRVNASIVAARVGTAIGDALPGAPGSGSIFTGDDDRQAFTRAVYDRAEALRAQEAVTVRYVLTEQGEQSDALPTGFYQSVPGIASMFVMFTVLGGINFLLKERKQWTLQRLVVMPVSRTQLLGGKIIARFVTGMIQFVIVFLVGVFVGISFGNDPIALVIVMAAFTLCITALTFAIAPMIRSETQAGSMLNLIVLTLAPLGGAWWPLEIAPDFMQAVGRLSPVAWAMNGFNQLMFYGGGFSDVLVDVGVLLAASAVLFVIGIVNFRYE